jgi:hypothetical protein
MSGGLLSVWKKPPRSRAGQPSGSDYGSIDGHHGNDQEELARDSSFDSSQPRLTASVNRRSSFMPSIMRRKNSSAPDTRTPETPSHMLPYQRDRTAMADDQSTIASASQPNDVSSFPCCGLEEPFAHTVCQTPDATNHRTVDSEGFTVPPANHDRSPWQPASSLLEDDEAGNDAYVHRSSFAIYSGHRLRRLPHRSRHPNRVSAMAIQQTPIQETEDERAAALLRVQSTLLSGTRSPSANGLSRRTTRGRRPDGRPLTSINPIPDDMELGKAIEQNRLAVSPSTSAISPVSAVPESVPESNAESNAEPESILKSPPSPRPSGRPERAMSMMSTSSSNAHIAALPVNPFANPTAPGIRASVTETVHLLVKGGAVERIMLTGEVALSVKDVDSTSPIHLLVANHEHLEKSAPNAQYIEPVPSGQAGEYRLDLEALRNAASSNPVLVLKYQCRVDPADASKYVPIELEPQWRCSPTKTDLLLNYKPNPASKFASPFEPSFSVSSSSSSSPPSTLQEVSFLVPITSSVTALQSKPEGIWSPEKRRLLWKVGDIDLAADDAGNKALARFVVGEESRPQPIAVKWRIVGRLVSDFGLNLVGGGGDETSLEKPRFEEVSLVTQAGKHLAS